MLSDSWIVDPGSPSNYFESWNKLRFNPLLVVACLVVVSLSPRRSRLVALSPCRLLVLTPPIPFVFHFWACWLAIGRRHLRPDWIGRPPSTQTTTCPSQSTTRLPRHEISQSRWHRLPPVSLTPQPSPILRLPPHLHGQCIMSITILRPTPAPVSLLRG